MVLDKKEYDVYKGYLDVIVFIISIRR